jgi:hypothetical protein
MDSTDTQICFTQNDFKLYVFLFFGILGYIIYVVFKKREELTNIDLISHLDNETLRSKIIALQQQLYDTQLDEQRCQTELQVTKNLINKQSYLKSDSIYNPLTPPNRMYVPPQNPNLDNFQMIGYVYNNNEKYPLFGRYKFPGRSDKWEYYIVDESRNRLKIPFRTKNDQELYDNDPIDIPTMGGQFITRLYEFDTVRYNPNLI